MGKKLTATQIKKELKNRSKDELIELIYDLCKTSKEAVDKINIRLGNDDFLDEELVEAKKRVRSHYFTTRGFAHLNLRSAKSVITTFKKICNDQEKLLDLELYYVECGIEFTNALGDINESFYNSMGGMYETVTKTLTKIGDREMINRFIPRLEKAVDDTKGIGWGFGDWITDSYYELKHFIGE